MSRRLTVGLKACPKHPAAVRYILENMCSTLVSFVEVDGVEYSGIFEPDSMANGKCRTVAAYCRPEQPRDGLKKIARSLVANLLPIGGC